MVSHKSPATQNISRREFVKHAGMVVAATSAISIERLAHAEGREGFRVGLIGCGGRGSGAAANAMNAGKDIKLVAMGDIFEDHLRGARERLKQMYPDQVQVDDEHCFVGFDAYQKVIASDVDVVIIAAASHFHPVMLKAAVEAGKHVFCEKPHAIDVPGLKMAMAACEEARKKNLAVVSGLCWRYDYGVREAMKRVLDGAIGEIVAIQETYITTPYVVRPRQPGWGEAYYQFQNWYHFNWLSGDQTSQQLIHSLDKASWALHDRPPLRAWGLGGRQACLDPKYGDQFDHHALVFEYDNGVRVFGYCRDIPGCYNETSDIIFGTKGRCHLPNKPRIEGEVEWQYTGPKVSMYDVEHKEMFDSIRAGNPINNGNYMFTSTMLGILAQMVCYTGQLITWEEAMQSTHSFSLPRYGFDIDPPVKPGPDGVYPTAVPGITKFA